MLFGVHHFCFLKIERINEVSVVPIYHNTGNNSQMKLSYFPYMVDFTQNIGNFTNNEPLNGEKTLKVAKIRDSFNIFSWLTYKLSLSTERWNICVQTARKQHFTVDLWIIKCTSFSVLCKYWKCGENVNNLWKTCFTDSMYFSLAWSSFKQSQHLHQLRSVCMWMTAFPIYQQLSFTPILRGHSTYISSGVFVCEWQYSLYINNYHSLQF